MTFISEPGEISFKNGIVVLLACLINCLIMGCLRLSSLLFVASLDRYGVSREEAALPFFLVTTVRTATGPLIGYLGKKLGPRLVTLYGCIFAFIGVGSCYFAEGMLLINIFWGGILGLGAGLGSILLPQILSQHFAKHLDKANGLCLASECLGGFLAPGLFLYLVEKYGLSGTYLIISAFVIQSVPASMLLKILAPTKKYVEVSHRETSKHRNHFQLNTIDKDIVKTENQEEGKDNNAIYRSGVDLQTFQNQNTVEIIPCIEPEAKKVEIQTTQKANNAKNDSTSLCKSLSIFLNPVFILIMYTQSMSIFIAISAYTILVDFSRDANIAPHEEIYPVMVYAIADIIGRFGVGFITDGGCLSRIKFTVLSYTFIGVIQIIFPYLKGSIAVLIIVFLYASLLGSNFTVASGVVVEFIKGEHLSMAFSSRFLLCAPLSLIISPMIGFFREHKGSYEGLFYILGAIAFSCAILTSLIPVFARRRKGLK